MASVTTIIKEAKLVVEELILERSIYSVRYRMKDARIFDQTPFVAGTSTAANHSDRESNLTIKVSYVDTRTRSLTKTERLRGVPTKIHCGLVSIVDGEVQESHEVLTGTLEWRETTLENNVVEAQYTLTVPPKTKIKVSYVGKRGKCSVPFSYVQRDQSSVDGQFVTTEHMDGIYTGANYHSFNFEHFPPEPL